MNRTDLQSFFRFAIGFDEIADIMDGMPDNNRKHNHYPPYNIEKIEGESYCITVAVAGFEENNIEITKHNNVLVVDGNLDKKEYNSDEHIYLYKGIAERSFHLQFRLADHMEIKQVILHNGMLRILMHREIPEELKPQKIKINTIKGKNQTCLIDNHLSK